MSSSIADHRPTQQLLQPEEYAEDKKCRICGFADTKNVNIFSPGNCKALVTKILTVYPIVLYKNDPLPKNICKKCICNVSLMYNDVLRVMKMQSKWINNVRAVQPYHNYIRVLDLIDNANNVTRDSIKATLGEDVNELSVGRFLLLNKKEQAAEKNSKTKPVAETSPSHSAQTQLSSSSRLTSSSLSLDFDNDVKTKPIILTPKAANCEETPNSSKSTEIKDIKSLLESNGCSLLKVGSQKTNLSNSSQSTAKSEETSPTVEIKKESQDESGDNTILYSLLSVSKDSNSSTDTSRPGPPPPLTTKCRLCPLQFNSLETLSSHQLIHMRLCIPKIFQKKYLHKRVRRGRLISVQDRKCIRCLNCWRVFVDNKSILEHWSMGECDFYCHICGKEFAQAPKMLREHVPAAHGISYRSSKFHRVRLPTKIMMSVAQTPVDENPDFKLFQAVSEQEPLPFEELGGRSELPKVKTIQKKTLPVPVPTPKSSKSSSRRTSDIIHNVDGSVSCHICLKVFQNFKARNSHMRKHKPVYVYGDTILPASGLNSYMKEKEVYKAEEGDCPVTDIPSDCNALGSNYSNTPSGTASTQPTGTPSPSSSGSIAPPRGVRTKFVNRRVEHNGSGGVLKVKPLNELQKKFPKDGVETSTVCTSQSWVTPPTTDPSIIPKVEKLEPEIKDEPMDTESCNPSSEDTESEDKKKFTCIPCSDQFPTKLELFRHKRKCRATYTFTCEYCSEVFRCSADHQQHVTQSHKSNKN